MSRSSPGTFRFSSWNVAAINNNPFEYWVFHPDPAYEKLMVDVQQFVDDPQDKDILVNQVITPSMVDELAEAMTACGWQGVDEVLERYHSDLGTRRIVSGFLEDKELGSKRLCSMPDRFTNTIDTDCGQVYRPCVINMYEGREEELSSLETWWPVWKKFMFEDTLSLGSDSQPASGLLVPIRKAKYPALTEDEERLSLPLQTLCLAIFDAILIHMMNTLAPGTWLGIKHSLCEALCHDKPSKTVGILASAYQDRDVLFLQEAAGALVNKLDSTQEIASKFAVLSPADIDSKRDQNSLMLVSTETFDPATCEEITRQVVSKLADPKIVAPGDLLAVTLRCRASGNAMMLASFHGDTGGLATQPILEALYATCAELGSEQVPLGLVVGIDANTYYKGSPNKKYSIAELHEWLASQSLTSCFAGISDPLPTTYNARTFLQPQLNKAVKRDARATSSSTDRNPKDFIIFPSNLYRMPSPATLDNSGRNEYGDHPIPSTEFPSDHCVISADLEVTLATSAAPAAAEA